MKRYDVGLDPNKLYALADELEQYAKEFEAKVQLFLTRLADVGISVAKANGGFYGDYIVYSTEYKVGKDVRTLNLIAQDSNPITNTWYPSSKSGEPREETISPLLMAEFGSGQFAIDFKGIGGRGTLNKYGHADDNGWGWWTDDANSRDGVVRNSKNGRVLMTSNGFKPSRPLHNAIMACIEQIESIAREVFA